MNSSRRSFYGQYSGLTPNSPNYDPSGRVVASSSFDTLEVCLWNAHTGKKLLELGSGESGNGWSVQFSRDGLFLGAAAEESFHRPGSPTEGLRVWRLEWSQAKGGEPEIRATLSAVLHGSFVNVSFSPDGGQIISFQHPRAGAFSLVNWPFKAGEAPKLYEIGQAWHWQAGGLTPDGGRMIVHPANGPIVAMDPASGRETVLSGEDRYPGMGLALSPDGRTAACIRAGSASVAIWDARTGKMRYALPEESGAVWWMAWSPDNQRLAITRSSGEIAVWSLAEVDRVLRGLNLDGGASE